MAQFPAIEIRARAGQPLGMSPTRFLRDYWQKRPLLIRGAFADFQDPLAPDDLAGLACEPAALARIVVHEARRDRWKLRTGPFDPADFARLPKRDWTLLVQDVDKWDADVATLLPRFSFLPSWRIDDVMVSYAEDGGSVGAHVDQYDVFLLQGLGRRRWQLTTDAAASREFRTDAELKLLREFTPTHEWILEPGDMLYLPPGVPHHGVAVGPCMTYSIGMRAPSQAELLVDFAETVAETLPDSLRLADPDLAPVRGAGEIDDAAIAHVMRAMPWLRFDIKDHASCRDDAAKNWIPACAGMTESMDAGSISAPVLRAWFGRFITRYRSAQTAAPNPRPLSDAAFARALARGAEAQRNPWSRFAWMREAGGATLYAAGDSHACSQRFARLVCALARFPLANAPTARRDRALLRTLVDAGHLAITR